MHSEESQGLIIFYCIIAILVFFVNINITEDGWLSFARAVFWPIFCVLYLLKYTWIAFILIWK